MSQELSTVKEQLAALAKMSMGFDEDMAGGGNTVDIPDRISIEGNRFSFNVDGETSDPPDPTTLHFVVLGVKKPLTYTFYEGVYDPKSPQPPTWVSHDGFYLDVGELPEGCREGGKHPA